MLRRLLAAHRDTQAHPTALHDDGLQPSTIALLTLSPLTECPPDANTGATTNPHLGLKSRIIFLEDSRRPTRLTTETTSMATRAAHLTPYTSRE